jgi:hypothetical protein
MEPKDATKHAETTGDDFGFIPREKRSISHKKDRRLITGLGIFVWGELD